MSLLTPEDDLELYNKLNEYSDMTDDLTNTVNENNEITIKQKQDILYPMIEEIRIMANEVIENYIQYLKDKDNTDKLLIVKSNINNLLEKIDYFKNKIYEVYKINNKG